MARVHASRRLFLSREWNPLRGVFELFTSVRFAILFGLVAAAASLLGVVFPQMPNQIRFSPTASQAWLETQRGRYGPLTDVIARFGLFEVFSTPWFNGIFVILLVAVAVCTFNRFAPTWRMVRRPVKRVNDRYFERARARAASAAAVPAPAVETMLRRRHFRVERTPAADGTVYLFGERYPWAALATFATHLSLILFMAGGIVSKLVGFETFVTVTEQTTAPVFGVLDPRQMFVQNLRSHEGKDSAGNIIDYYTNLVIYKDGKPICEGKTTVNNPLSCNGYRFHQSSYSGDLVALKVRNRATGAVVYSEAPLLSREPASPSPRFVVQSDQGEVLYDDFLVPRPIDDRRSLAIVAVERLQKLFTVVLAQSEDGTRWSLNVLHIKDKNDPSDSDYRTVVDKGRFEPAGGLMFGFPEVKGLPAALMQGIPGIEPVAMLQLVTERDGSQMLDVQNPARADSPVARLQLRQGEAVTAGEYEYQFDGPRAMTGVLVKRDPGSWLIWIATGLLVGGLGVTFYVPRRRVWARITPERVYLAGMAERNAPLGAELQGWLDDLETKDTSAPSRPKSPSAAEAGDGD